MAPKIHFLLSLLAGLALAFQVKAASPRLAFLGDSITHDGRWPTRVEAYQDGIVKLKTTVEKQGGKIIFITPPLHNGDKPPDDPNRYDAVLDTYADWLVSRRSDGWQVIDIRPDLKQAVAAERVQNPEFLYAKDNVHPGDEGHRFIADSITRQLWPILKLPEPPKLPNDDALAILRRRSELVKLAWLTKTRHIRPGVPTGLPLDQANGQAAELMKSYLECVTAASAASGRSN